MKLGTREGKPLEVHLTALCGEASAEAVSAETMPVCSVGTDPCIPTRGKRRGLVVVSGSGSSRASASVPMVLSAEI